MDILEFDKIVKEFFPEYESYEALVKASKDFDEDMELKFIFFSFYVLIFGLLGLKLKEGFFGKERELLNYIVVNLMDSVDKNLYIEKGISILKNGNSWKDAFIVLSYKVLDKMIKKMKEKEGK